MANDLIAGAWRNGLDDVTAGVVAEVEKRRAAGFRQLAYEKTCVDLIDLLDSQDNLAETLLMEEGTPTKRSFKDS